MIQLPNGNIIFKEQAKKQVGEDTRKRVDKLT